MAMFVRLCFIVGLVRAYVCVGVSCEAYVEAVLCLLCAYVRDGELGTRVCVCVCVCVSLSLCVVRLYDL